MGVLKEGLRRRAHPIVMAVQDAPRGRRQRQRRCAARPRRPLQRVPDDQTRVAAACSTKRHCECWKTPDHLPPESQ